MLGVAYKQDIDDIRHSPALVIIEELEKTGAIVEYYDPYVKEYSYKNHKKQGIKELTDEVIKHSDLILIATAHTNIDYDFIQKNAKAIFDTKNAMKDIKNRDNIELL